jgi:hypothetical protein
MPQQVRRGQEEAVVRKTLTPEQAREIARKSHQRLRAQAQASSGVRQPAMPENTRSANQGGIQVQLVKRPMPNPQSVIRRPPQAATMREEYEEEEEHITKEGAPDRRFIENRSMPAPPKRRDSVGLHLTKEGKPDRRYLENQHLTEREAEIEKAKDLLRSEGIRTID